MGGDNANRNRKYANLCMDADDEARRAAELIVELRAQLTNARKEWEQYRADYTALQNYMFKEADKLIAANKRVAELEADAEYRGICEVC